MSIILLDLLKVATTAVVKALTVEPVPGSRLVTLFISNLYILRVSGPKRPATRTDSIPH
jgi:hypothetical protein